jgi:hypothetical protein
MQPTSIERVRFLKSLSWLTACLTIAVLLTGCGEATSGGGPSAFTPENLPASAGEEERARAIELLDKMQRTTFDSAFVQLQNYAFTRTVRTERRNGPAGPEAFRERTLTYTPDKNTTFRVASIRADSSGSFDASVLGRFAPSSNPDGIPTNLATQAFPEDPPYLAERKREAFQYNVRSDTYEGAPVNVVIVQARNGESGPEQSARFAELTLHRDTHQLLAAHTVYTERTLLYAQDTVFRILLHPAGGETWLPRETEFRALLDMILRDPLEIATRSTYSELTAS